MLLSSTQSQQSAVGKSDCIRTAAAVALPVPASAATNINPSRWHLSSKAWTCLWLKRTICGSLRLGQKGAMCWPWVQQSKYCAVIFRKTVKKKFAEVASEEYPSLHHDFLKSSNHLPRNKAELATNSQEELDWPGYSSSLSCQYVARRLVQTK